jgi:hypothetical protein
MSATAAIEIGSDLWNAGIYASLATASELAAELDKPNGEELSAIAAGKVSELLCQLNGALARGLSEADKYVPDSTRIPKERLIAARDSILDLHAICVRLLSHSNDLNRYSDMKSQLETLDTHAERLLDLADWFDALSTPEEIQAKMDAAMEEIARGEVVPLSEFR